MPTLLEKSKLNQNGQYILFQKDLEKYEKVDSLCEYSLFWLGENPRYFFKAESEKAIQAEILVSRIFNKLGLKCIDCHPAQLVFDTNGKQEILNGVISEDYLQDRTTNETISGKRVLFDDYETNSLTNHFQGTKRLVNKHKKFGKLLILDDKLDEDRILAYAADHIVNQKDRYAINMEYVLTYLSKRAAILSYGHIFDNAQSCLANKTDENEFWKIEDFELPKSKQKIHEFVKQTKNQLSIDNDEGLVDDRFEYINKRLAEISLKFPALKRLIKNFYKIDVKQVALEIESKHPGFKFDPKFVSVAKEVIGYKSFKVLEQIKLLEKQNSKKPKTQDFNF